MNSDQLTAAATVAGVIVAAVFGATGFVVALVGLSQAKRAKASAAKANKIAKESNALAKEANELVEAANRVIQEQTERETERSDVAWEWRWDPDLMDHIIIQNIGKSSAKQVVAQFFFETSTDANEPIDVKGREEIRFQIPSLADRREFAAEAERTSVQWAVAQRLSTRSPIPPQSTARVRLRVTWLTPKGTPKLHDTGYSDESLLHNAH